MEKITANPVTTTLPSSHWRTSLRVYHKTHALTPINPDKIGVKSGLTNGALWYGAKGFTLIELLVTMALIGALAVTVTIINPVTQFQKARDSQRKSDLKLIQSVLEFYMSDNGYYPISANYPACGINFATSEAKYLDKMPCDPKNSTSYFYSPTDKSGAPGCLGTTCTKYTLIACLEYASDPDKDSSKYGSCSTASYSVNNP